MMQGIPPGIVVGIGQEIKSENVVRCFILFHCSYTDGETKLGNEII